MNGKKGLVINLKYLNSFVEARPFKYDDIRTTLDLVEPEDVFTTIDLKDYFFHVPVHADFVKYLGFQFRNVFYEWLVLPFGFSLSPYYTTKIIRPVLTYLRNVLDIRCQCYVDDWLILSKSHTITDHTDQVCQTLQDLGYIINVEKSHLIPSNTVTYIGFEICSPPDGSFPTLWVSKPRVLKLRRSLQKLLLAPSFSARDLARVLGQCVSMSLAVQYAKIMLRHAYTLLNTRLNWDSRLCLNSACRDDLLWWLDRTYAPRRLLLVKRPTTQTLYTDASASGWGATLGRLRAAGSWNSRVSFLPSNQRELLAILMAFLTFRDELRDSSLMIFTDNITSRAYLLHQGGPHVEYNRLTRAIFTLASRSNIHIQCSHVRGVDNVTADHLSRQIASLAKGYWINICVLITDWITI